MASAGKGFPIGDWAELLPDLLTSIAKRLHFCEDFVAFGGVCRSWRSVAVKQNFNHSASSKVQIPWLMLAEEEESSNFRGFASLLKNGMVHKVQLPEARGKRCIGSLGWLITIDGKNGDMELLHPLTRVRVPLPHPRTYKYYKEGEAMSNYMLIHRAVLSASPSLNHDYVVMIIFGSTFYPAFWRPGNSLWTVIEQRPGTYLDVIYHKDQFYAINSLGNLVLCEVDGPNSGNARDVGEIGFNAASVGQPYLVESGGDLLVVNRRYRCDMMDLDLDHPNYSYWSYSFRLFKFDSENLNEWQEINDLGGGSIFVGHSAATFVPHSAVGGIRPNCIYFSDNYSDGYAYTSNVLGGSDMGIYNLETQTIEPLFEVHMPLSRYCPPIWVPPSF